MRSLIHYLQLVNAICSIVEVRFNGKLFHCPGQVDAPMHRFVQYIEQFVRADSNSCVEYQRNREKEKDRERERERKEV